MVEYHVDTLPQFQDIVDKSGETRNFGGSLSVRIKLGERLVICLGQYEAIFKHYIFTNKMWNKKGKFWLVPKNEVCGIMVLAFQSKEFGFGYTLKIPELQTIN